MSVSSITIKNFKNINNEIKIDFKPITLLFGPNSSGKSTIIQALHYAQEIFSNSNLDADVSSLNTNGVHVGGFKHIVRNTDYSNEIKIGIEILNPFYAPKSITNININPIFEQLIALADILYVELIISWDEKKLIPIIKCYSVKINNEKIIEIYFDKMLEENILHYLNTSHDIFNESVCKKSGISSFDELDKLNRRSYMSFKDYFNSLFLKSFNNPNHAYEYILNNKLFECGLPSKYYRGNYLACHSEDNDTFWAKGSINDGNWVFQERLGDISLYNDSDEIKNKTNNFDCLVLGSLLNGSRNIVSYFLSKFLRIGPYRKIPDRLRIHEKSLQENWIDGLPAYDTLYNSDDHFISGVNNWLSQEDLFNLGYKAYVKKYIELDINDINSLNSKNDIELGKYPLYKRLVFVENRTNQEIMPQDVGFGFSQVFPIIVASIKYSGKMIAVEQPELHIHPSLQSQFGDLFISHVCSPDSQFSKFLIETHSEFLILRILKRIKEISKGEKVFPLENVFDHNQLAIYFFDSNEDGIVVSNIRVDKDGDFLDRWPRGFFKERTKEFF